MAGHLRNDTADSIFIHWCTHLELETGLLGMQNFPFIFKILYPNVGKRGLIYAGAKEMGRLGED